MFFGYYAETTYMDPHFVKDSQLVEYSNKTILLKYTCETLDYLG